VSEVEHVRTILARGTSAHRQLALYKELHEPGLARADWGGKLVQYLIDATASGLTD
jgi:hypothetical protein